MSLVTVHHTLLDLSENPCVNAYIEVRTLSPQVDDPFVYSADGGFQVVDTVRTRSDVNGEWDVDLIPTDELSPVGTVYEVIQVPAGMALSRTIIAPRSAATPVYELVNCIVDEPGELASGPLSVHLADAHPHAGHIAVLPNDGDDGQVLGWTSGPVWTEPTGGGSGAPTDATYLTTTANGSLSAEVVVGATPGGELGGSWSSPTVDSVHAGSSHAQVQAAAESTAATALTGHVAAGDPHTQYLKESEYHSGSSLPTGDTTGDVLYWNQDQATPGAVWDAGIGDFGLSYAWAHVGLYLGEWAAGEYGAGSVVFKAATGELYFAQGTTTADLNNSIWQHHDGTTPIIFHVEQGVTFPEGDPTRPIACQGSLALVDAGGGGAQLWQMSGSEWLQFANGDVNLTPWRINADGYFVSDNTNVSINVPDSNGVLAVGMLAEDLGTTGAYFLMYGRNSGVRAGNAYATLDSRDRNAGFIVTAYTGTNTDVWKFQADGTLQIFSSIAEEGDVLTAGAAGVVQWQVPAVVEIADNRVLAQWTGGPWDDAVAYIPGDLVSNGTDTTYLCTHATTGDDPTTDADVHWTQHSSSTLVVRGGGDPNLTGLILGSGSLYLHQSQNDVWFCQGGGPPQWEQLYPQPRPSVFIVVDDDVDNIPVNYWDGRSEDITIIVTAFTNNRGVLLPVPNATDFADGTKITFKVDASCSDVNYFQIIPDAATTLDGTTNPYSIAFPLGSVTVVIDQASNAWWFVGQYAPTP